MYIVLMIFLTKANRLAAAIDICLQAKQSVYDCLHVALAERETCDLVTDGDKLVKNLQATFPFINNLSSRPGPPPTP